MKRKLFFLFPVLLITRFASAQNIFTAVSSNDIKGVCFLLNNRNQANLKDAAGVTPLMVAVVNGNNTALKLLLEADADVNTQDSEGNTALMLAAQTKNSDAVAMLLNHYPHLNIRNHRGLTALSVAIEAGDGDCVKTLKAFGAKTSSQKQPVVFAADYVYPQDRVVVYRTLD